MSGWSLVVPTLSPPHTHSWEASCASRPAAAAPPSTVQSCRLRHSPVSRQLAGCNAVRSIAAASTAHPMSPGSSWCCVCLRALTAEQQAWRTTCTFPCPSFHLTTKVSGGCCLPMESLTETTWTVPLATVSWTGRKNTLLFLESVTLCFH